MWMYLYNSEWCLCSWLSFDHLKFLFNFFIFSSKTAIKWCPCFERVLKMTNQGELGLSRTWIQSPFGKNKTKHTYFVSNAQSHSARGVQASPSVLYKLQKSFPVASTGHGKLSFWVSGFIPTDRLHCSPWRKCLPTAVLSCTLSATIAVMKMEPAMIGLREMWPALQCLSVHSSGHLAGLPLGHLLEDGR